MTKQALRVRVRELEGEVQFLRLMVEEARIVADVERQCTAEVERRMATWLTTQEWARVQGQA